MSTPRSCLTCTRITSVACPSCETQTCWCPPPMAGAHEGRPRAPGLPSQAHPDSRAEVAPDQLRTSGRPSPGPVHRVIGRHG
jgi:hypothetical protein